MVFKRRRRGYEEKIREAFDDWLDVVAGFKRMGLKGGVALARLTWTVSQLEAEGKMEAMWGEAPSPGSRRPRLYRWAEAVE
jgi:hypothetical protein